MTVQELTVQELASEFGEFFIVAKRPDGVEFLRLRDKHPRKLQNLVREAHAGMMPDDVKYEYVRDALYLIGQAEEDAGAEDIQELGYEIEADVYTTDLTEWLHSHIERVAYLDAVLQEFGGSMTEGAQLLMAAQVQEKQEVFVSVLDSLVALVGGE